MPWATPTSIAHGCNTPCVEVSDARTGGFLILDAGSGLVGLNESLGSSPRHVPILLTHYHWDHTQGLPFFAPLYMSGWSTTIHAPAFENVDAAWVGTMFQCPFFPVPYEHLPSPPAVSLVQPGRTDIGGFEVSVQALNHPGGAFAYRIHGERGDVVYATDHEAGSAQVDDQLALFARDARLMIIDAHFTPEELPRHTGWGHSSWTQAVELAARCGTEAVCLFHHKPGRTDQELLEIERSARHLFPGARAAREGSQVDL